MRLMRASRAMLGANRFLAAKVWSTDSSMHHGIASRIFTLEERFRDLLVSLLATMVVFCRVSHHLGLVEAREELRDWRMDATTGRSYVS